MEDCIEGGGLIDYLKEMETNRIKKELGRIFHKHLRDRDQDYEELMLGVFIYIKRLLDEKGL